MLEASEGFETEKGEKSANYSHHFFDDSLHVCMHTETSEVPSSWKNLR